MSSYSTFHVENPSLPTISFHPLLKKRGSDGGANKTTKKKGAK